MAEAGLSVPGKGTDTLGTLQRLSLFVDVGSAPLQPPEVLVRGGGSSQIVMPPGGALSPLVPALTPPSLQVCQRIRRFCPRRGHLHGPGSLACRLLPAPLQHVHPEVGIVSPTPVLPWLVLPPHPLPPAAPKPWSPRVTLTWTTP